MRFLDRQALVTLLFIPGVGATQRRFETCARSSQLAFSVVPRRGPSASILPLIQLVHLNFTK
jgi:hypothetical protein